MKRILSDIVVGAFVIACLSIAVAIVVGIVKLMYLYDEAIITLYVILALLICYVVGKTVREHRKESKVREEFKKKGIGR